MSFNRFPEIHTERLLLRKIESSDADVILFLRKDEVVNKFIDRPESRQTKTYSDAIKFINDINKDFENGKSITWGISFKNIPQIMGTICLWNFSANKKVAEVGYDLNPEFHKKGVMSEALYSVIDYGFNKLKLSSVEAFTNSKNTSSKKLLVKIGFQCNVDRTDMDNSFNEIFEIKR